MENYEDKYFDIFKVIRTIHDARQCLEGIESCRSLIYEVDVKVSDKQIHEFFPRHIADKLLISMENQKVDSANLYSTKSFFDSLYKILKQAKSIEITIAIEPDDELVVLISNFLRETLTQPALLINLKTNRQILGGIEMVCEGRYLNLSIDKQIDEWFRRYKDGNKVSEVGVSSSFAKASGGKNILEAV